MAKKRKSRDYRVGKGKPPTKTQFKPGKSGNPKGRPKGSKNFSTVIEKELNDRVAISENGKERKLSKRELAAKQLVNKAASGDMKAVQTIFKVTEEKEETNQSRNSLDVLDTPEHHLVIGDICRRIRAMEEPPTHQIAKSINGQRKKP